MPFPPRQTPRTVPAEAARRASCLAVQPHRPAFQFRSPRTNNHSDDAHIIREYWFVRWGDDHARRQRRNKKKKKNARSSSSPPQLCGAGRSLYRRSCAPPEKNLKPHLQADPPSEARTGSQASTSNFPGKTVQFRSKRSIKVRQGGPTIIALTCRLARRPSRIRRVRQGHLVAPPKPGKKKPVARAPARRAARRSIGRGGAVLRDTLTSRRPAP